MASLPSRGAWIEMQRTSRRRDIIWSLPSRGAWIEITISILLIHFVWSLPSRGAWIEIITIAANGTVPEVAPLAGSVD